jgi:CheY-like chemotaxis protein
VHTAFKVCLHEVVVSRKRKNIKVLVIEDDLNMCIYLCNLLRANGFDPSDAQNRVAGIKKVRSEKPALIVLDGMLPDEESITIYYRLKSDPELQHIPVVMLASIDQRTFCYYQKCQQLQHPVKVPDPEAFLTKPPEAEEFLTIVKRLVKSPSASQRKAP